MFINETRHHLTTSLSDALKATSLAVQLSEDDDENTYLAMNLWRVGAGLTEEQACDLYCFIVEAEIVTKSHTLAQRDSKLSRALWKALRA